MIDKVTEKYYDDEFMADDINPAPWIDFWDVFSGALSLFGVVLLLTGSVYMIRKQIFEHREYITQCVNKLGPDRVFQCDKLRQSHYNLNLLP